jgi:tetratricopeptide (TPR) repeat protein
MLHFMRALFLTLLILGICTSALAHSLDSILIKQAEHNEDLRYYANATKLFLRFANEAYKKRNWEKYVSSSIKASEACYKNQEFKKALSILESVKSKVGPNDIILHQRLIEAEGKAWLADRYYQNAIQSFEIDKSTRSQLPSEMLVINYLNLSEVHLERYDYELVEKYLDSAKQQLANIKYDKALLKQFHYTWVKYWTVRDQPQYLTENFDQLQQLTVSPREKIELYRKKGRAWLNVDYDSSLKYLNAAQKLSFESLSQIDPINADLWGDKAELCKVHGFTEQAIKKYQRAISILSARQPYYYHEILQYNIEIAFLHLKNGDRAKGRKLLENLEKAVVRRYGEDHYSYYRIMLFRGIYDHYCGVLKTSLHSYTKAEEFLNKNYPDLHINKGNFYHCLGSAYAYRDHDINTAKYYYEQALAIKSEIVQPSSWLCNISQRQIGDLQKITNENLAAISNLKKSISINTLKNSIEVLKNNVSYISLASLYYNRGMYDSASYYYDKVSLDHFKYGYYDNNSLARYYELTNRLSSSQINNKQTLTKKFSTHFKTNPSNGADNFVNYLVQKHDYVMALQYLVDLSKKIWEESSTEYHTVNGYNHNHILINYLYGLTYNEYYKYTGNTSYLDSSLYFLNNCYHYVNKSIVPILFNDLKKNDKVTHFNNMYYLGIQNCIYHLNSGAREEYIDLCYLWLERFKNRFFVDYTTINNSNIYFNSYIKEIRDIKNDQITALNKYYNSKNIIGKGVIANDLIENRNKIKSIINSNPHKFDSLKLGLNIVSVKTFQESIHPDELVLQYYLDDDFGLILYITKNTKGHLILSKNIMNALPGNISFYRKGIKEGFSQNRIEELSIMQRTGFQLYRNLLEPVLSKFDKKFNKLIIIPDGELGYLPFELLCQEVRPNETSYRNLNYLIKDYDVQYAHSSTLFVKQRKANNSNEPNKLLAFAPEYTYEDNQSRENDPLGVYRGQIVPLTFNVNEVKNISNYLNGKIWERDRAIEENFKRLPFKNRERDRARRKL